MENKETINLSEKEIRVSFEGMGLDTITSDFLNWALKFRDNLEWLKEKKIMELHSASAILYFNDLKKISRIDKIEVNKR